MAGNKEVLDLPVVPTPDDGHVYIVKDGVNYRIETGSALGLATLGADGILTDNQRPESSVTETGDLIAGSGVLLSGTLTDRLVGTGNVTITASGGSSSSVAWGAITGTLSSQADLQSALNAKANTTHTHAASDIVSGTLATARLGSGTADSTKYLRGDGSWQTVSASVAWGGITGTLSSQSDLNAALAGKANLSHTHAASDITSGVLATARLGTGSATSSTFLRGDGTWALTSSGSATWGAISGTLADQTDLQTALNNKVTVGSMSLNDLDGVTINLPVSPQFLQYTGSGWQNKTFDAADILTGTVPTARLGSGTASTTTFLRGDNSWQTVLTSDTNYAKLNAANVFTLDQTAPDFIATSDERLKYNIQEHRPRTRLAELLRFVSFIYKETDEQRLGLIAQEVLRVAPEYVRVDEQGYLGIDKAGIALEAVIGLAERVSELESKVS